MRIPIAIVKGAKSLLHGTYDRLGAFATWLRPASDPWAVVKPMPDGSYRVISVSDSWIETMIVLEALLVDQAITAMRYSEVEVINRQIAMRAAQRSEEER